MSENKEIEELKKHNKALGRQLDDFYQNMGEDGFAFSIYLKAKPSFKKWIGL